jgi:DNA relaxase NicK
MRLERRAGRNFFKHGYYISDSTGKELFSFHWGGQRGRVFIEIKGGGCKLLDAWQWSRIHSLAVRYKARINRFDLAGDDWEGKIFILKKIMAAYKKDKRSFLADSSLGNKPLPLGVHDTYKGVTLEVGTSHSSSFHVIYQKFRESEQTHLGRMNPRWMRWEVRFRNKSGMKIDLSIIHPDNWGAAYLGSCGHLRQLLEAEIEGRRFVHRVEDVKESALEAFMTAHTQFGIQWGPHISECYRLDVPLPCKRFSDNNTPYAALTIYDQPEILQRIASASRGALRSIAAASVDSDDAVLF